MDKDEETKEKFDNKVQNEDNLNETNESASDEKEHSENNNSVDYYENMRNIGKAISEAFSAYTHVSDYMSSYKENLISAMRPMQEAMASVAAVNASNMLKEYAKTIDMSYVSEILGQMTKPVITDALSSAIDMIPDYSKMLEGMFVATDSLREIAANMKNALQFMSVDLSSVSYDVDLEIEADDKLLEVVESIAKGQCDEEEIKEEDEKSGGKLRKLVIKFFFFIIVTICAGYIERLAEPIYKAIDNIIIHKDADANSEEVATVPIDSEIIIWSLDDEGDYVEVSYGEGKDCKQGYISKETLKNNTILIKEGVGIEQLGFTDYCVDLMAEHWNITSSEAYGRLSGETSVIDEFLIPNYHTLSTISDEDLVKEIENNYSKSLKED